MLLRVCSKDLGLRLRFGFCLLIAKRKRKGVWGVLYIGGVDRTVGSQCGEVVIWMMEWTVVMWAFMSA